MKCTEIAQWLEAIGTLLAAGVALFTLFYFEIIVARRQRQERRNALIKAAMDEAILNEDFAGHNARTAIEPVFPGVFIHQPASSCIQAFHGGTFDVDNDTRTAVREYIEGIEHVNSMIRNLELAGSPPYNVRFLEDVRAAIHRYCGGQMDRSIDGEAKSLLQRIQNFRKVLETKFKKELEG